MLAALMQERWVRSGVRIKPTSELRVRRREWHGFVRSGGREAPQGVFCWRLPCEPLEAVCIGERDGGGRDATAMVTTLIPNIFSYLISLGRNRGG